MADFALSFSEGASLYTFTYVTAFSYNFGDGLSVAMRLPGMHGGYRPNQSEPMAAAVGSVSINFGLFTPTKGGMQALIDAVYRLYALGEQKLTFQPQGTANPRFSYATVNNIMPRREIEGVGHFMVPVTVIFQTSAPFWTEAEESVTINAVGTSTTETITNAGNAPALARVTVSAAVGYTTVNPAIQREVSAVTVDELEYVGTLGSSDVLEMSALTRKATLNSLSAYASVTPLNWRRWLWLEPGANTIKVIQANAADRATVKVYWSDTYR